MKNKLLILCLLITGHLHADTRIMMYITHAPSDIINNVEKEIEIEAQNQENKETSPAIDTTKNPGYWTRKSLKSKLRASLTPSLSGILALYAGYSDYSNVDGLISFPLRHEAPKLYIAVTRQIRCIPIKDNTASHLEYYDPSEEPLDLYLLEKLEDTTGEAYWKVSKTEPPADRKVSHLTVILCTKPENIIIPTGEFLTNKIRHLIVPPIYLVGNHTADNVMSIIDHLPLFEPITSSFQYPTESSQQKLIQNR